MLSITWNALSPAEFVAWVTAAKTARIVTSQGPAVAPYPLALNMYGTRAQFEKAFPEIAADYWDEKEEEDGERLPDELWEISKEARAYAFSEEPPDYGDVMSMSDFNDLVEQRFFIDYDGFGTPMKDGKCMRFLDHSHTVFYPSERHMIPKEATHICWFNR